MRSFNTLASWRWCLLVVLSVGCAHSSAGTTAAPVAAAESSRLAIPSEASPATADATGPEATRRKERKVRKLMALTGVEDTGKQMLELTTSQFEQMSNIPPGFMEKFREVAQQESIVDMLVPVYMKYFSEEDLDAAITFHESPAGKRFLAAQPLVMQEAKEVGEQWGVRLAEKTLQALAEEEQQLQPARHEGQQL
ncbi:DUF2059 domain-containing protein [Archangium sp.]|uniref:DUF2059 domain-containing protein n=1 Tax=Archangium sp. TaxID=1872627 RepID=UPI002D329137|nr:DUF2059 domain-containing protein [Archangium sp.]HYO51258.1 DUF2059 domain-containing protein [Archangium sp.]